jgi:universal stress protein F
MYNTILVPIELSHEQTGISAVKIATNLINDGGKIILVNVVGEIPAYIEAELPIDLLKNSINQASAKLTQIAKDAGIEPNVEIRKGQAATLILDSAQSHKADLIIVASHRPGLSDYFLGSTAARIVRHAQCAVLVDR